MSTFDDQNYRWRETYFVFCAAAERPSTARFEQSFSRLKNQFELTDVKTDADGRLESARLVAPAAFSAIDITIGEAEEVEEQLKTLGRELRASAETHEERAKVARLSECDTRYDVLHFERVADLETLDDEDEPNEMFDPGALLIVMERLVKLCNGVGVDPASCTVM